MKVMQLAILGIAGVAAVGAGYLALNLTNQDEPAPIAANQGPQIELEEILVAVKDIPLGTSLRREMFEWRKWPKDGVEAGYISKSLSPDGLDLDEKPAIVRQAFFKGEPIREAKLNRAGEGYLSAILPAGKRAIATSISTSTSAGGFILPNDHVDVIMTRRSDESGGGDAQFVTETVLENVRVLAIDQTIEEKDGEPVVVGETATLQLSPDQARILTVAQQMADRLALTLRSLEDSEGDVTKEAKYLLSGARGSGRIRLIKYGNRKDVLAGPSDEN